MKRFTSILLIVITATFLYAQEEPKAEPKQENPKETVSSSSVESTSKVEITEPEPQTASSATVKKELVPKVSVPTVMDENRLLSAIENNPKEPDYYYKLFRLYSSQNKHKEKLKIALKAIQNLGGNAELYIIVGDENKFLGDFQKAIIAYQFALRMRPSDPNIYNRVGLSLLKISNFNQAEAAFKAALFFGSEESNPTKGVFYNNLAVAYEAMRDLKNAYKYFQVALKYYPSYTTAQDNIARVQKNLKETGISLD